MQIGTNIDVTEVMSIYRQFLFDFKSDDETNETSPYIQKITQLIADGDSCLNLDCGDLRAFPTTATLYSQLVNFPTKVIPILDSVLIDVARELNPDESSLPPHLHVLHNLISSQNRRAFTTSRRRWQCAISPPTPSTSWSASRA